MKAGELPIGFPTHSVDILGRVICLGDKVGYDFDDSTSKFIVVFEDNAFRKQYPKWDISIPKPILEFGHAALDMRLKIFS